MISGIRSHPSALALPSDLRPLFPRSPLFQLSRFTFHVSRFTFHVSRFTFHPFPVRAKISLQKSVGAIFEAERMRRLTSAATIPWSFERTLAAPQYIVAGD
jgi:hypothetical protein